ncbi:MAG: hypothetical protein ACLP8A_10830 [Methylovirgula sp.]
MIARGQSFGYAKLPLLGAGVAGLALLLALSAFVNEETVAVLESGPE